jgi:hypothetical protein
VAAQFLALYPNRIKGILRPAGCDNWTTVSKHWPIPDATILSAIAGQEASIWGLRWEQLSRFAMLDIDQGSKYHCVIELQKLQAKLAAVEVRATIYRSSLSDGWHLYLFWQDWANCKELQETLKAWLYSHGYEIRNGVLEIFPSGNGLRLPLQPGFAWLDDNGELIAERKELRTEAAISRFLLDLENNANNWEKSKSLIKAQLEVVDRASDRSALARQERLEIAGFDGLFNYRLIAEKYEEGHSYWQTGLTAKGQRHDAILGIEHYLWHGDAAVGLPALPGEWNDEQRYRLILAWLKANHNGFCNHINRGNWRKVEAQIRRAVKWRRPFESDQVRTPYPLTENIIERLIALSKSTGRTWSTEDLKKGNDGREAEARKKISEAVPLLIKLGQKLTVKGLALASGCSRTTVRRHLDIWKISPAVALSKCTGDQNPFLDLDLLGGGGTVPCGSGVLEKENLLPVLSDADSGYLALVSVSNAAIVALVADDLNPDPELELLGAGFELLQEQEEQAALPAVAPSSSPLAPAWLRLVADEPEQPYELAPISLWCLTPYAETLRGDSEQLNGKSHLRLLPPSDPASLATGSSTGALTCKSVPLSTCGLNGFPPTLCAGPSHLNPRDFYMALCARSWCRSEGTKLLIFYMGARVLNLTARGERQERSRAPPV